MPIISPDIRERGGNSIAVGEKPPKMPMISPDQHHGSIQMPKAAKAAKKTAKKTTKKKRVVKSKKPKAKRGRPSSYRETHGDKLEASADGSKGWTDSEIAELFGVTEQTVNTWKKKYPEFLESVKRAKEPADDAVERALFQRATGYSVPDVNVTVHQGTATIVPIIKHYAPDVVACIFWLKNRRKDHWRDKQEIDHGVTDEMGDLMRELDGTAFTPRTGKATKKEPA